jgi:hypothetical protein
MKGKGGKLPSPFAYNIFISPAFVLAQPIRS